MTVKSDSIIGIIGGGQLGRMTAEAAQKLGYHAHIFTDENHSPASQIAYKTTVGSYTDARALKKFADSVNVITFEFENIPPESIELLEEMKPVFPSANCLRVARNRLREKTFVNNLGIGTAPFRAVTSLADLEEAVSEIGLPAVLKTTEMGYDGKGQVTLRNQSDCANAWGKIKTSEAILEGFVDFTMEISVIVARSIQGETKTYVPMQNIHKNHILDVTIAPAPIDEILTQNAEKIAVRIAEALKLQGLLAVEMFVTKDGRILVNEMAPRPHNSGHWTMDAAKTSQFEQLVRIVCGLPLGSTEIICKSEMKNLIGDEITDLEKYKENKNARIHIYGKKEARPGRKMGHVNFLLKS